MERKETKKTTKKVVMGAASKGSSSSSSATKNKVSMEEAAKSIDELFETRKRKEVPSSSEDNDIKNQPKSLKNKKVKASKTVAEEDEDEDDGGMEYEDDDPSDQGTYGIIQSRYRPSKIINPEAPLERIDPATGLPVYKAHLLKVGEGGGTPLCPFDCNCCF